MNFSPKKLLPSSVKTRLKKYLDGQFKKEKAYKRELLRLKKIPRYTKGKTSLLEYPIEFPDSTSFIFMFKEIMEAEVYKFKADTEQPKIIDAGGNIGLGTIYLKKLYPNSKITVFEPDPTVFEYLNKNISSFKLKKVNLIQNALWSDEKTLHFTSEGADGGRIQKGEKTFEVKTIKLSSYLDETVDFLKIDIEGAEIEVLKESAHKLNNVKNLFIEFHSFVNKKQALSTIIDILEKNGFRYYLTTPGLVSPHPLIRRRTYMGMDMQLNIYAKR